MGTLILSPLLIKKCKAYEILQINKVLVESIVKISVKYVIKTREKQLYNSPFCRLACWSSRQSLEAGGESAQVRSESRILSATSRARVGRSRSNRNTAWRTGQGSTSLGHVAQIGAYYSVLQEESAPHLLVLGQRRVSERRWMSLQVYRCDLQEFQTFKHFFS